MEYVWSCSCGEQTECTAEDQRLGAVFRCPGCRIVFGCVRPRAGGKAWVAIGEPDVEFHQLLGDVEEKEAVISR